jgi:hypothetical protein
VHERNAGGAADVAEQAEGHDRDQPGREQECDAAAVDQSLDPLEALLAGDPVEQRPGGVVADRVRTQSGEHPGPHHQREPDSEIEDVAGRGIQDLGRIPDHDMDHRQPKHEQGASHVSPQVLADRGGIALHGVEDGITERRDRERDGGTDQDARNRHGDAGPGSSAGRAAVHVG